jgi:O-antigen ligase
MITEAPVDTSVRAQPLLWFLGLLAVVAPTLLAAHEAPSVTFYNQALGVLGWGLFVAALGRSVPQAVAPRRLTLAMMAMAAVFLIYALEAFGSAFLWGQLPGGLGLMGCGLSLAGWLVLQAGWRSSHSAGRDGVLDAFFSALAIAGGLGMVLALIQVFWPAWADGMLVAAPTIAGRAVGNLRQPNHFSTLLVWACCGASWLGARRFLPAWAASGVVALFIWGVVLTASRTGMVGMVFFSVWGLLDKRLPRVLRATLIGAPLIYGLCWGGMWLLSHVDTGVAFAAEARLHDHSDISSSRFKIWANVLEMIRQQPWLGVGYGEFNIAWTLTPFPTRPVAFFDHTHNLPLQWAVELGLPVAALMLTLGLASMWVLFTAKAPQADANAEHNVVSATIGACGVMVAIAALHSLLEYPLWYSYFLLPTAFAWGAALGVRVPMAASTGDTPPAKPGQSPALLMGGLIMSTLAIWCALDYQSAVNIYAPRPGAGPLDQRIATGKRMPWWGYQADYADVTAGDDESPSKPPAAFKRTMHNLLDARLMIAYARSLEEHGEVDKARYVIARLKEFRNPMGDEFLAVCKTQPEPDEERAFQCDPPTQPHTWREVLPK